MNDKGKWTVFLVFLSAVYGVLCWGTYHYAYKAGVKSVPAEDCTSEVQVAEQGAYSAGVAETVKAAQAYILESCTRQKEITVAGETFVCLKKQEM